MRLLRAGLAILVAVYLGLAALFYFKQSIIYFPAPKNSVPATPALFGLAYEDLTIGGSVHAWWIPQQDPNAKTAIFFHGNAAVLDDTVRGILQPLRSLGVNVLLIDYRGYGSSSPIEPNEATVFEDADASMRYLLEQRKIPAGRIFPIGASIGAGPAVYLAARYRGLAGLILESPPTSIDDVARRSPYLRWFPLGLLLRTHFDNSERMPQVRCPVLIAVGERDTSTPAWMARQLYQRAHEPRKLVIVPNAHHFDLVETGGSALQQELRKFVYLSGSVNR
jgi:fermentation-respiration switch protein FrsA (DUF1100 family)